MKKRLIIGAAAVGAVVLAGRMAAKRGGTDWAAMIERMPDNAPPKWMFRNITAIRENTERILEKLEAGATPHAGGADGESKAPAGNPSTGGG